MFSIRLFSFIKTLILTTEVDKFEISKALCHIKKTIIAEKGSTFIQKKMLTSPSLTVTSKNNHKFEFLQLKTDFFLDEFHAPLCQYSAYNSLILTGCSSFLQTILSL
jgi:hypothetical protein